MKWLLLVTYLLPHGGGITEAQPNSNYADCWAKAIAISEKVPSATAWCEPFHLQRPKANG